ncbi:TetR/AcrR family transcriptional regulator [Clostridium gasigenes]|uniref:TetR/AcrR family transcriptional regulator n=1 Tax=Clostridium gasigenes TaxID=94869 RepID=UPI001C0C21C4|nr:TetR/AcrR family transcriptional regulator [Clostridium gasigenes]MBU3133371.1 TetR/AcrR family transcriptional regulator [Clostridium gasigenes]
MNKYEIRTNTKKLSIINSATVLFKENGFVNVSIKEIATQANVSPVSIYNYFGNKDALVGECVSSIMSEVLDNARQLLYCDMSFKEKISTALTLCSTDISKSFSEYFTTKALSDKIFVNLIIENINEAKFQLFRKYIELGKVEGAICSTLSTDTIMRFIEVISIAESKVDYNTVSNTYIKDIQTLLFYGVIGK